MTATDEHWVIVAALVDERRRQLAKWGEQHHYNGTSVARWSDMRDSQRALTDARAAKGEGTWLDILLEETYEAAAEIDDAKLRAELVQVMAVAGSWIEDIDSRRG